MRTGPRWEATPVNTCHLFTWPEQVTTRLSNTASSMAELLTDNPSPTRTLVKDKMAQLEPGVRLDTHTAYRSWLVINKNKLESYLSHFNQPPCPYLLWKYNLHELTIIVINLIY